MNEATLRYVTVGEGTDYPFIGPPQVEMTTRQNVVPVLSGGGAFSGADVGGVGQVSLEVYVLGDSGSPATVMPLMQELLGAWAPVGSGVIELELVIADQTQVYRGRPLRPTPRYDLLPAGAMAAALLPFTVIDDRWYSATPRTVTVTVAGSSGGMDTPMDTPMVTTGSGSSGDASVANDGTAPAPWSATLFGPLTTPRLILDGHTVQLDGDLLAGQIAVVDSLTGSVLVDGAPRPWVAPTSDWWEIPPGASTFSFRASAGTGTATLVWRDASY